MENETTEINYWQRARINLNLAKSRQLLRVHAEERRLGRCRFMHMPRRRRLRDWDKITSGCTRCNPIAYKHRHPLLRPSSGNHHFYSQTTPTETYPSLSVVCSISCPAACTIVTQTSRSCVYIRTDYMRTRPYTTLSPRCVRVYAADKSSVLMCARKGYRCTRTYIRYVYKVMCERVYIRARRENKYRHGTRAEPKR